MIKNKLENWIKDTLSIEKVVLEHPADLKRGDFTWILPPLNIEAGDGVIEKLEQNKLPEIDTIELVNTRFINFFLKKEFFAEEISKIDDEYGKGDLLKGQKIMVEFTDANPLKEFHIGHLMDNAIGESVARILQYNGAKVIKVNWQGDVGIHIAKAVWGKLQKPELSWGKAYAYGSSNFEDNKEEIIALNKKIYSRSDTKINELYDEGRKESLDHFETIYNKLGMEANSSATAFDHYFFESQEGVEGKKIVEDHMDDGVFEKSDGAIIFRGERYGLHTRVFINSEGLPVYEAKELGLNKKKFEVEPDLDKSIIFTGNEIKEYFKVLLKVFSLILPQVAEKTLHIPHGMLKLPSGKMSSRTGDVITAESLIDQVKERVKEKINDDQIAEEIAVGAIKFSILRQAIGGDIIFDFDRSISFEGDSGPYLQYTTVRANSVLQKSKALNSKSETKMPEEWETTDLERILYRFPEVVEIAYKEYAPHKLVSYLLDLASRFNSFYAVEKIIDDTDPASSYKLVLTATVATVLTNGLHLLGIKVPERM